MVLAKLRDWFGGGRLAEGDDTAAAERVWGAGFFGPGGAAEIARLIAPMRPAPGEPFLLVSEGSPGEVRAVAATSADVTAFATGRGRAARTDIRSWNRAAPDFGPGQFARGLALEPLGGAPVEPVVTALAAAIMPVGQLTLVELVAEEALDRDNAVVAAWLEQEARDTSPPPAVQIERALGRLGFALHAVQDLSAHHVWQARQGWNAAMACLNPDSLSTRERTALVAEGERWRNRLRLLATGRLRLICWQAVGKAPIGLTRDRLDSGGSGP